MSRTKAIPADEMLLAEAIAAAKARGLKWCAWSPFKKDGYAVHRSDADSCCALGALALAGCIPMEGFTIVPNEQTRNTAWGNDLNWNWRHEESGDHGESLGWAFRQAMQEGE